LDLGDRRHPAGVLDDAAGVLAEETTVTTREVLAAFFARYPGATVVRETGTHRPWISRAAAAPGHPVIVAEACNLRVIAERRIKSTARPRRLERNRSRS
jgi:kynurenine formamidase